MSQAFGLDLAEEIASLFIDGNDVPAPTSVYVKLHDGDAGSDGTANELDSTAGASGYTPVEVSVPSGFGAGADATELTNTVRIEDFGPAEEDWPEVTHFSIWTTADQTGRVLFEDSLTDPKTVTNGDPVVIAEGNATIDILE
jgi:hypothetical protein